MENSMKFPQKTKNRVATWFSSPTPGHIPRQNCILERFMHPCVHGCTIPKAWKQPKCPLTDEWIKMWYIYTMEYYLAMKKNEIMSFAATCVDLEIDMLSEVRYRKKIIIWYPLYAESKKKWYKWTYIQNRNRLTDLENEIYMIAGEMDKGKGLLGSLE